jgi:hypothetical protein
LQKRRRGGVEMHRRAPLQQRVDRREHSRPCFVSLCVNLLERDRAFQRQVTDGGSAQPDQVRAATQRLADIFGQRADVRALAACDTHREHRRRQVNVQQRDGVNRYLPRRALDGLPGPGILVKRLAVLLERRVHRRHLFDLAGEARNAASSAARSHVTGRSTTISPSASPVVVVAPSRTVAS